MYIELTKAGDRVNVFENHLWSLEADLRAEVTQLKIRRLKAESSTGSEPYAHFVDSGLRFSKGEDIFAKAKELITSGVQLPAEVMNAEHTQARDDRSGIVYTWSAQTHAERVLQNNTMTLLKGNRCWP